MIVDHNGPNKQKPRRGLIIKQKSNLQKVIVWSLMDVF